MRLEVLQDEDNVVQYTYHPPASRSRYVRFSGLAVSLYLLVCLVVAGGAALWTPEHEHIASSMTLGWLARAAEYVRPVGLKVWAIRLLQTDRRIFLLAIGTLVAAAIWLSRSGSLPESVLAMRSIGLQTTSQGRTRFMPLDEIEDVLIHEGFVGFGVKYYLAVQLRGQDTLQVVFPLSLPSRSVLERVYKGTRNTLFGSTP
ncbi:hypothetical protein PYCC9005_001542 [Savitreella phatthalungensis]